MGMRLYDTDGQRLYINDSERRAFIYAAEHADRRIKALGLTLLYTGCRISEALELTPRRIDLDDKVIAVRSLKKRTDPATGKPRIVYRSVPVPSALADCLNMVYGIREIQRRAKVSEIDARLWGFTRAHALQLVKQLMHQAGITDGAHKTAKGLRHAYGIHAISSGVPLNVLQELMGHATMETTAIYATPFGKDRRAIVERMWT